MSIRSHGNGGSADMNTTRASDSSISRNQKRRRGFVIAAASIIIVATIIAFAYYVLVLSFNLEASIDPGSLTVPKGKRAVLTMLPLLNGDLIDSADIECEWIVVPESLGLFYPLMGNQVVFQADNTTGTGQISCVVAYRSHHVTATAAVTIGPAVLNEVRIDPGYAEMLTGETRQFNASTYDSTGVQTFNATFTWTTAAFIPFNYTINSTSGPSVNLTVFTAVGMNLDVYASRDGITVHTQILIIVKEP
jgi:hypothetical protein